jgi:hypothetical protein
MGALLSDDIDTRILDLADQLSDDFATAMPGETPPEFREALSGLQLTFLQQVVRLARHE